MTVSVKDFNSSGKVKRIEIAAVVYRACPGCKLSNPAPNEGRFGNPNGRPNEPWSICPRCGTDVFREDRGVIAFWHSNPVKRLWHWVKSLKSWS